MTTTRKNTGKKTGNNSSKNPELKKKSISAFFDNVTDMDATNDTLINSIQRGTAAIEEIATNPLNKNLAPQEEISSYQFEEIEDVQPAEENDTDEGYQHFEAFLRAGYNRKDTCPVRILKKNYNRLEEIRKAVGGEGTYQSIPKMVDFILDTYLKSIEKYLSEEKKTRSKKKQK